MILNHSLSEAGDLGVETMEVDSGSGFVSRTLMVLKGKTSPETRLSTEDLQVIQPSSMTHNFCSLCCNIPHQV